MNAQRARRWRADADSWTAPIVEQLGAAGRHARLLRAVETAPGIEPDDTTVASLRTALAERFCLAGAEALHAASYFRLMHEGGIDREARESELAEAFETARETRDLTSASAGPDEQLLAAVRDLGEAGDVLVMARGVWERRYAAPEWVEEEHESVADAVRFAFGQLLVACLDAVAIFAPDDLDPNQIEQPSFWDELKALE